MSVHPRDHFNDDEVLRQALSNEPHVTAEAFAAQSHAHEDAATKCKNTDLNQLVQEQLHLNASQKVRKKS